MRASNCVDNSGIYYIRNINSNAYLNYSSNNYDHYQAYVPVGSNPPNEYARWILGNTSGGYYLETGFGSQEKYLCDSGVLEGPGSYSLMKNNADIINLEMNYDGTYTIFNSDYTKILTCYCTYVLWKNYTQGITTISNSEKWSLEKCNYLRGDADSDGEISILDITAIQRHLAGISTLNNIQRLLSDTDRDTEVSIIDVYHLQVHYNDEKYLF